MILTSKHEKRVQDETADTFNQALLEEVEYCTGKSSSQKMEQFCPPPNQHSPANVSASISQGELYQASVLGGPKELDYKESESDSYASELNNSGYCPSEASSEQDSGLSQNYRQFMLPDMSIDSFDFEFYSRMAVRDFCLKQINSRDRLIQKQTEVINFLLKRV